MDDVTRKSQDHRLKWPNLDRNIAETLARVLSTNPYVRTFRSLAELGPLDNYKVTLNTSVELDQRVYNRPTTSEDLKEQLFKKHLLGEVKEYLYVIEFQKRGLPHAHFLLIMHSQHKYNNPDHYDKVVCAEIRDSVQHPQLHAVVVKHMIHGPRGSLRIESPCMQGDPKVCRFRYPRQFNEQTAQGDDAYPLYRRRNNGIKVDVRGNTLDNRWVVPYNPKLLMMFNCHMNVEVCSSIKSVKYLFKYVYKGHDKQVIHIDPDAPDVVINEIKRFQDARYVSPPEAMERNKRTMLTKIFDTNKEDEAAWQYLHKDFPKYFTWKDSSRSWNHRIVRPQRGRIVSANPAEGGRYYLRILLSNIKGPTSFEDLCTVNGEKYTTFRREALEICLIENDDSLSQCLTKASLYQFPNAPRRLFATIMIFCEP
ncbi:hypothetical protein M8C21_013560 [Ambrosia artemisiifolia]|uniref:Helitron helicase-like domain-containing protein n=1 Tax=Ambrosia artemisiifolia TaxID=4212 RepID=A0AAD5CPP4_AMBAR|nr:hypothetical protein M8C21_013560 [Ambrosia artemisiifolia]